jgi:hypothetical protein
MESGIPLWPNAQLTNCGLAHGENQRENVSAVCLMLFVFTKISNLQLPQTSAIANGIPNPICCRPGVGIYFTIREDMIKQHDQSSNFLVVIDDLKQRFFAQVVPFNVGLLIPGGNARGFVESLHCLLGGQLTILGCVK